MSSLRLASLSFLISFLLAPWVLRAQNEPSFPVYGSFADFEAAELADLSPDTSYVFNFWATWCAPCIAELPYFEQLSAAAKTHPIKVRLITLDLASAYNRSLLPFLEKRKLQAPVIGLTDGRAAEWIDLIDPSWSGAIPATLFITGGKRHLHEGAFASLAELAAKLPFPLNLDE